MNDHEFLTESEAEALKKADRKPDTIIVDGRRLRLYWEEGEDGQPRLKAERVEGER